MRVKTSDINPELRGAGRIASVVMRPSRWFFKLMLAGTKRTHGKNIEGLDCSEVHIARGDGTTVRTRIFKPLNAPEKLPALLYLPGGGYAVGAPETFLPSIQDFIGARPCVVVSPDYRKSLEAPYPAAIDDCYTALIWLRDNAEALGARSDQIMVGGHSAGGGLTAAVTLRARDRGDVKIAFQMPIYPMIDDRNDTESARDNNAPLWSAKHNRLGWDLYLADLIKSGAPIPYDAAPARATDYSGLPPALTYVGDIECFRDETIAYVENLKRAGVPVEFELFKGCYHGFDMMGRDTRVGSAARRFVLEGFARAVDTRFAAQNA